MRLREQLKSELLEDSRIVKELERQIDIIRSEEQKSFLEIAERESEFLLSSFCRLAPCIAREDTVLRKLINATFREDDYFQSIDVKKREEFETLQKTITDDIVRISGFHISAKEGRIASYEDNEYPLLPKSVAVGIKKIIRSKMLRENKKLFTNVLREIFFERVKTIV